MRQADGDGWELSEANWWRLQQSHVVDATSQPKLYRGWVMHRVEVSNAGGESCVLCFSRRYDAHLSKLAQELKLLFEDESTAIEGDSRQLAGEFS